MKKKINDYLFFVIGKTGFTLSRVVEMFLLLLALWWAFVLFLPTSTFAISATYMPMALVAGEIVWAGFFLILATILGIGLWKQNQKTVQSGLLMSMVTWMFVGTTMVVGSFASTGSGVYILISLLCASVYFYKGVSG